MGEVEARSEAVLEFSESALSVHVTLHHCSKFVCRIAEDIVKSMKIAKSE